MASQRYRDEEWLCDQWQTAKSVPAIAERCNVTPSTIRVWARRYGLPHFSEARPYNDPERLREMYHDEGKNLAEIGDELGCSKAWVGQKMDEFGIERRGRIAAATLHTPHCQFYTHPRGYELVASECNGETGKAAVHQLTAIAHGADPHDIFAGEYVVHHENRIKWDNRPSNLTTMTQQEHGKLHHDNGESDPQREVND